MYKSTHTKQINFPNGVEDVKIVIQERTIYESPYVLYIIEYDTDWIDADALVKIINKATEW